MLPQKWITELNQAFTEERLVAVASGFLGEVRRSNEVPDECLPAEPRSAVDIRSAASALAHMRMASNCSGGQDKYQQLLILFSLAADRIGMLEARGILAAPVPGHPVEFVSYGPPPAGVGVR